MHPGQNANSVLGQPKPPLPGARADAGPLVASNRESSRWAGHTMDEVGMTTGGHGPGVSAAWEGGSEANDRQHRLVCRAGARLCAVPLSRVIEVMRVLPIKPVARGPQCVRGLCIIRGAPVLVIDTGLLISNQATDCQRLITVRTGGRTIALAAEAVLGIVAIDADKLGRLPPLLGDGTADTISAIGSLDAELLFFLQTTRIIPDDLFDRLVRDGEQL